MAASKHTYPYSEEDNLSRSSQHLPMNAPLLLRQSQEAYPKLLFHCRNYGVAHCGFLVKNFIYSKRTKSKVIFFNLYAACTRPFYRAFLKQPSAPYNYCFGWQDVTDESFKVPCAHFYLRNLSSQFHFIHLDYSMEGLPKVSLS